MNVLQAKANLHKPVQNLLFWEELVSGHFLDLLLQVAVVGVLHHDAELALLLRVLEKVVELNYIWVIGMLEYHCFIYNILFFLVRKSVLRIDL